MAGDNWSDTENDLTVAAYFGMLRKEILADPFIKSEVRRSLRPLLDQRSDGAIEFKFQNISAVLLALGQPWIDGYKPASRFQQSLIDAVLRWLSASPDWLSAMREAGVAKVMNETAPLWIGPPPTHSNQRPPVDLDLIELVARKFDVAARDERNRALGRAGEELVLESERTTLRMSGMLSLAERVRWIAQEDGDGAGYDIASFELDGRPRLIEVKTTNGWERTPFHITRTELAAADSNRDHWHLIRVWNFAKIPKAFSLRPPLDAHVQLTPTSFLASLQ